MINKLVKNKKNITILLFFVLLIVILISFFRYGEAGITPLRDYCLGIRVNQNFVHKIFPDANFKIGLFVYDVDEKREKELTEKRMLDFKNSIRKGTSQETEEYWSEPYCIGHQYRLE